MSNIKTLSPEEATALRQEIHPDRIKPPAYSYNELAGMIAAESDTSVLIGMLADRVTFGAFRDAERHVLRKQIAKKAGVSVASLNQDAKAQNVSDGGFYDHRALAVKVVTAFGAGNLINSSGYLWRWSTKGLWQIVDDRSIKQKIHEVVTDVELTAGVVASITDLIKTEVFIKGHEFDKNQEFINCQNGELYLIDGAWELRPHERDHYRTSQIAVTYDAKATAPKFEKFLNEIFEGDVDFAEKAAIILEMVGYSLTTSTNLEKLIMLIGAGSNGKSVLLKLLEYLIGRKYVSAVQPDQLENKFQRAHLQGKHANIVTEMKEGCVMADAQIKSLVTGELMTAEHKHQPPFDFVPFAKFWFATNHLPHTRDFSEAFFRRVIILTFNNRFEGLQKDVHLAEKLKAESPGILNMALEGLRKLYETGAFTECSSSEEIIKKWRYEADQAAQFLDERCEIVSGHFTSSQALFYDYDFWAKDAGVRLRLGKNTLSNRLERLGGVLGRGRAGERGIYGIKLTLQPQSAGTGADIPDSRFAAVIALRGVK